MGTVFWTKGGPAVGRSRRCHPTYRRQERHASRGVFRRDIRLLKTKGVQGKSKTLWFFIFELVFRRINLFTVVTSLKIRERKSSTFSVSFFFFLSL